MKDPLLGYRAVSIKEKVEKNITFTNGTQYDIVWVNVELH